MISTAILHTPWRKDRCEALAEMMLALSKDAPPPGPLKVFGEPCPKGMAWAEYKTVLADAQWAWALGTGASHHLFLTDDLHIMPRFWEVLRAMVRAKPDAIIGLLSNHPAGPGLHAEGANWYRCNSWVVGPAYLVPHAHLESFLAWYRALESTETAGGRRWFNDDSALNEWNTRFGPGESWHPLPTCIEHRGDLPSTVGHGDRYSLERLSWRAERVVQDHEDGFSWISYESLEDVNAMCCSEFWDSDGPMLKVGG